MHLIPKLHNMFFFLSFGTLDFLKGRDVDYLATLFRNLVSMLRALAVFRRSMPDRNNGCLRSNGWNGERHKRHTGAF